MYLLVPMLYFRESLIRTAFQCLQLVVTDFLPTMPCTCLQIVVEVAGSFGLQNQELNISLTSIGLLVIESTFVLQELQFSALTHNTLLASSKNGQSTNKL